MTDLIYQFHFLRPWGLLLLIPAMYLAFFHQRTLSNKGWSKAIDPKLLPYLSAQNFKNAGKNQIFTAFCYWLFLFLTPLALSGPTFVKKPQTENFETKPITVMLELSSSMTSQDLRPSRLQRAKFKLKDLLAKYPDGQVSLVAFAKNAYVVTPATKDKDTIENLLTDLSLNIMPKDGVSFQNSFVKAQEILSHAKSRKVLYLSSSNFEESGSEIAKAINKTAAQVLFWAFASESGAPVKDSLGRFKKNKDGSTALSQLAKDKLDYVKNHSASDYVVFTPDDSDTNKVLSFIKNQSSFTKGDSKQFDQWVDFGPYILLVVLALFLLLFLNPNFAFLGLLLFAPSQNLKAADFLLREDQKAQKLFDNGQYEQAALKFEDPIRKGTAYYKAGQFKQAIEEYSKSNTELSWYNTGNAYAQIGNIPEAIKSYERALKLNPHNNDAKHNKEVLEKKLQENPPKEQEQKENQEQENQPKDDKNNQQQSDSDNNEQNQDQQDQSSDEKEQDTDTENQNSSNSEEQNDKEKSSKDDSDKTSEDQQSSPEQSPENSNDNNSPKNNENQLDQSSGHQKEHEPKKEQASKKDEEKAPQEEQENPLGATNDQPNKNDNKAQYYFDKVENNSQEYLRKKFLYESLKNKGLRK